MLLSVLCKMIEVFLCDFLQRACVRPGIGLRPRSNRREIIFQKHEHVRPVTGITAYGWRQFYPCWHATSRDFRYPLVQVSIIFRIFFGPNESVLFGYLQPSLSRWSEERIIANGPHQPLFTEGNYILDSRA